ncbi:phosphatidylinositolglycan class N [Stachybotrys elegans]|uniref:GPI ethanolamine phosphate transferase 1 n=1 Tax=Stachybotrys elegans TaxID=80388 RepID=A0A8K0T0N0_9HYPO|nr:phosphatidylinositolglycan class N [Stachybotrys elegans]
MAGISRLGFLATAVIFHVVFIFSIFDIYFVSPIVSGMRLYAIQRPPSAKAPADRLVLFVGDGLRADKAFQSFPEPYPETEDDLTPRPLAPFLRTRIINEGTFGVSHTRVPTESRPGHVALIAGLYEDVSAVATGWKMNPVNFDSVFNRSRHTWSWGSPDILPMFEHGATPGRVDTDMYDAEFEDFSKDALHLDLWVFDHVKEMFAEAATNKTLNDALRQDKVVFFLHLLGIDTTGHGFRPYSDKYLYNIKVVDQGVKEITELINDFYKDDRTAFVFTADHGMHDLGSHGDGHPDNTRTPLITWGSGVAKPEVHAEGVAPGHDEYSADWGLNHIRRHDVEQADVAALMAYLIGAEFPANSVGRLPLSFLSANIQEKAEASLVNAQEILEMYRVKEEKKAATQIRFRPFEPLSAGEQAPDNRVALIRSLIEAGKHEEAIEEADALITIALEGLRYLQTYDWLFLRALITLGYLGWMVFAITTVLDMFVVQEAIAPSRTLAGLMGFSSLLVALYAYFIVSKSPLTYYAYAFFPVAFWEEVHARRHILGEGGRALFGSVKSTGATISLFMHFIIYIAIIVSLALSYIHREILTGLYILGSLWPMTYGFQFIRTHTALSLTWTLSCLCMSTFTLLSAMKVEDRTLIIIGGAITVVLGLLYLAFEDYILADFTSASSSCPSCSHCEIRTNVFCQVGLIILSIIVTYSSSMSLETGNGLPLGNQIVGWIVLVSSLLMPLTHRLQPRPEYMHRLVMIFLTCAPTFVILTISYEGLFYVAFSVLLFAWVRLEYNVYKSGKMQPDAKADTPMVRRAEGASQTFRPLALSDARVALFFLMFLQSAFFSTGNMASVSAFSLESVNRLWPVFDPLSQGALLILKLMIPYAVLSANLGILNKRLGVAPSAFFMVVMAIGDVLTLYFFWVVKDEGSWLEIGSTISHFFIASMLCVFVALLEGVSGLFISGIMVEDVSTAGEQPDKEPKDVARGSSGQLDSKDAQKTE